MTIAIWNTWKYLWWTFWTFWPDFGLTRNVDYFWMPSWSFQIFGDEVQDSEGKWETRKVVTLGKKNTTLQIYYCHDYLIIIIIFVVTTIAIKKNFRYCHPSLPNRWSGTSPWRRRKPMVQSLKIPPDEYHSRKKSNKQIQLHSLDFLSDLNKHLN